MNALGRWSDEHSVSGPVPWRTDQQDWFGSAGMAAPSDLSKRTKTLGNGGNKKPSPLSGKTEAVLMEGEASGTRDTAAFMNDDARGRRKPAETR